MITTMPTLLSTLFAVFLPISVNSIEPTVDTRTINDTDEALFRNDGKYDENIFIFSACEADGFEANVSIHKPQIRIGMSKRISPAIDSTLYL